MSVIKIIYESLIILFGIACLFFGEPLLILLGLGLIAWGAYDLHKEVRDVKQKSEVNQLSKEREEIAKKLEREKD